MGGAIPVIYAPWLLGFVGWGIGAAVVGLNSPWMFAFAFVPVALGAIALLSR